ncbi:MAG TPA: HEAT repeat domain-containing protein [Gemmatimonadales bacterium]
MMTRTCFGVALALGQPAGLAGQQTFAERLAALPTGRVHLSFAARPGVCGDGHNNVSTRQESAEWEADCEDQPVRVSLQLRDQRVVAIRTYVGGRWRPGSSARDLGTVRPQEAAAYFLRLAADPSSLKGDPVLPASLADSVTIWPSLVRLARNPRLPEDRRRTAIFWLGQAAGVAATRALDLVATHDDTSRELRKQAVFALSQRPADEGVPALIRIARTNRDPELRKSALFWLGQSEDPRALDLFEEILR